MTTAVQLAQSVAPGVSLGFKNRILNGNMTIDQRNAGASVTNTAGTVYAVDRFACYGDAGSKYTAQQSSTVPAGFKNSLLITSSSSYSVPSGEWYIIRQKVEGFNVADLNWGSSNAKSVTLSFWVRSSLTGSFSSALVNSAQDRSYPFSYTISSADTWTQVSVTIPGDTTGTWLTNNGTGVTVYFNLGVGSSYAGTASTWNSGLYITVAGATSVVGTSGATFYITGVQLEVGTAATNFEFRDYGRELILCQRYYETLNTIGNVMTWTPGACSDSNNLYWPWVYRVAKRATPTVAFSDSTAANYQAYSSGGYKTVTAVGVDNTTITNAALLTTTSGGFTQGYAAITRYAGSGICAYANAEL